MLPFKTSPTFHIPCGTLRGEGGVGRKHFKTPFGQVHCISMEVLLSFGYWGNSNNLLLFQEL